MRSSTNSSNVHYIVKVLCRWTENIQTESTRSLLANWSFPSESNEISIARPAAAAEGVWLRSKTWTSSLWSCKLPAWTNHRNHLLLAAQAPALSSASEGEKRLPGGCSLGEIHPCGICFLHQLKSYCSRDVPEHCRAFTLPSAHQKMRWRGWKGDGGTLSVRHSDYMEHLSCWICFWGPVDYTNGAAAPIKLCSSEGTVFTARQSMKPP